MGALEKRNKKQNKLVRTLVRRAVSSVVIEFAVGLDSYDKKVILKKHSNIY